MTQPSLAPAPSAARSANAASGSLFAKKCAAIQAVAVEKGKPYLVVVGQNAALATVARGETKFNLTITVAAADEGGGGGASAWAGAPMRF